MKNENKTIEKDYSNPMYNYLRALFSCEPSRPKLLNDLIKLNSHFATSPALLDFDFMSSENPFLELSNKMVKAWNLPNPAGWDRAWEIFCGYYIAQKMQWISDINQFDQLIVQYEKQNEMPFQIANLLYDFYKQYKEPFFANTLYFMQLFHHNDYNNLDKLIWSMSAAAEHDLLSNFTKKGIHAHKLELPISGVSFDELLKQTELGFLPRVRPKIIVDQTHSYNFETYHLSYFLKEYGFLGTHSDRSLRSDLFKNIDVIVTHQDAVGVPFTEDEFFEITNFVRNGGGILLIGNYVEFSRFEHLAKINEDGDFPINTLAREFGFEFDKYMGKGKSFVKYDFNQIEAGENELNISTLSRVKILTDGVPVLVDEEQNPILAIGKYGNGRVGIIGGTSFTKLLDDLPVKRLFATLFYWLGENSVNLNKFTDHCLDGIFPGIVMHQGWDYEIEMHPEFIRRYSQRPAFIWPENEKMIHGVHILFAESMKDYVDFIVNNLYPKVYVTLREFYQCDPLSESVNRIHFYPHWGSGYTWMSPGVQEPVIGIPCLGKNHDLIMGIFSHELTHAWGVPGPDGWEHCWTTFTDNYFAEKLDLYGSEQRKINQEQRKQKLFAADPNLDKIDISIERNDNIEAEYLRWAKFAWMYDKLSKQYGYDLLAKYISLFRQYGKVDKESLTISDFIYYLSLAVGENLYPYFIKHGVNVLYQEVDFIKYK